MATKARPLTVVTDPPEKTPAEIPAEAIAAQQTSYEPALPLTAVHPHPKNPRHNAVADDELVNSIRDQGLIHDLVVAPHPEIAGEYRLIDGHRRYDALMRVGFTFAPAKIRLDLLDEADQLAAMLATIRREDLTPIEEAEGFDLLTELGWDIDRIAAATGRSKTTVSARRKLTRLPAKTKTAVDSGQVTIDDALAIAKLPAADQTRLEKYLTAPGFKYELRQTQDRIRRASEIDDKAKNLKSRGIPEKPAPKGVTYVHSLNHADHGMVRLGATYSTSETDHPDCLAFVKGGTKQYPDLWLVCTNPAKHDEDLSATQKERRDAALAAEAEREQQLEASKEQRRAEAIARQLRCDTIAAAVKRKPLDPTLETLIRLALPDLMYQQVPGFPEIFHELANVPEDQRWTGFECPPEAWLEQVLDTTGADLIRVLVAYLVTLIERQVENGARYRDLDGDDVERDRRVGLEYFTALAAAGHERNPVDDELLEQLTADPASEATS